MHSQLDPTTVDEEGGASSHAVPPSKRGRAGLSILRLHEKVANTGSTARDHLANERTFLAWLRTGLSLLAVGLAFARFATGWTAMLTGGLFVSLGAMFVGFSGWRYFQVRDDLMDDNFRCARASTRGGAWGWCRRARAEAAPGFTLPCAPCVRARARAYSRRSINTGGVILMLGLTIAVAVGCSIVMIALLVYDSNGEAPPT